jgi:acetyltransferase-like isoleucine patch superfamily enzyme
MEERMDAGLLWTDAGAYLKEQTAAKERMYEFNHLRPGEKARRNELIREMFGKVGQGVWMEPPVSYARGKTVTFGDHVYVNSGLTLVDDWKITFGSNILISPNVTIVTTGHPVHPDLRPHGEMYSFPVVIEDWVWIGSSVVILPGVTIGKGAVIGAGSIVTKDVPPMVVAHGNPCKVVRGISERDKEFYYKNLRVDAD